MGFGMGLSKLLYELQQIDFEFQKNQDALREAESQLGESETVVKARAELASTQKYLTEMESKQRDVEWEVEDLENNINQLKDKLYSGKIKNPKELVSLEHEVEILKKQLKEKEDKLLDLMAEVEATRDRVRLNSKNLKEIQEKWQQEQEVLTQKQVETKERLVELSQKREKLVSQIEPSAFQLYERIRLTRGQAVAKVEQGRCQGCRITLPVSEWQRARTGMLVTCGSCGRILHLE